MIKRVVTALLAFWFFAAPVMAEPLARPTGAVVLTISGEIAHRNDGELALFDREMLEALDWTEVETHTSFTQGPQVFSGPRLSAVLAAVGAQGATLVATAINDYAVEIPVADAAAHDVLLAMDMGGMPMRVRDKGPIWVVYPLSEEEAAFKPFDTKMIWQLTRLVVTQ